MWRMEINWSASVSGEKWPDAESFVELNVDEPVNDDDELVYSL